MNAPPPPPEPQIVDLPPSGRPLSWGPPSGSTYSMRVPGLAAPVIVSAPPPGARLEIPMPPTALRWLSVHGIYLAALVCVAVLFGLGKLDRATFVAVVTYVVGKYDERPTAEKYARILPDPDTSGGPKP